MMGDICIRKEGVMRLGVEVRAKVPMYGHYIVTN